MLHVVHRVYSDDPHGGWIHDLATEDRELARSTAAQYLKTHEVRVLGPTNETQAEVLARLNPGT